MKLLFKQGDTRTFVRNVKPGDSASFESGQVHPVYATFAIARDAEWTCRLFAIDMKDDDEEGIGTFISVCHVSPALVGENVTFEAHITKIEGYEIVCNYKATCEQRLIAEGENKQKILKKAWIETLFNQSQIKQ